MQGNRKWSVASSRTGTRAPISGKQACPIGPSENAHGSRQISVRGDKIADHRDASWVARVATGAKSSTMAIVRPRGNREQGKGGEQRGLSENNEIGSMGDEPQLEKPGKARGSPR